MMALRFLADEVRHDPALEPQSGDVARGCDDDLQLLAVRAEDIYRLCYVRGREGIIVTLVERIG